MVAFVQSASGTGSAASTVTVTLGANTTAGNCLVVATASSDSSSNPHVTGITLGGAAGNFAQLVSAGTAGTTAAFVEIWADPNCAGGQTSVVVTWNAAGSHEQQVWVYEFSGLATSSLLDKSSSNFTTVTGATFTSNSTATTTQASELWFGTVGGFSTTTTGPSSPWVNSTQLGSSGRTLMAGYQIVSATGTAVYSGTFSPNSFSEAAVVTLHTPSASVSGTVQSWTTRPVPRRYPARGLWGGVRGAAFVAVAAPPRLPPVPRRTAARAVWAGSKPFTGFVSVAAPRQEPELLPRRYPARAVWRGSAPFRGFVAVAAPRQQPAPAPRRTAARAYIRFTPVATTNATGIAVAGSVPVLMVNRTEPVTRVTGRVVRR